MSEFTKMKITLDFYNKNIVSVSAKQYDNQSRYIEISCTENGKAFLADKNTMSAYIRYRKPDGLGCFNDCEITDEGNILVELTEQMLSAQGKAEADIMLLEKVFTSGEKPADIEDIYEIHAPIISVMSFYVNIAPTALNHAQIESSYEFNALSNALSQIDYNNKKVEALDKELTENENERKTAEAARVNAENSRKSAETDRVNNENTRKTNETLRQSNEATRQTQENKRQTDTATAISNANSAAENANNKANDLQNKLESHHFVLTEDKDVAGGVAGLDSNAKVPILELYDASTTSKGIVQLTNSISSGSLSTAATPNSVKVAYDKTLSVETALNDEIARATAAENTKANIANPTFTGTPKAPTAAAGTNSTQIATTAFVQTSISNHNTSITTHSDIRDLISDLTSRLNALADSDDITLDQLSEIVAYIKSNRTLIENVTTNKVNVSDIVDNLTSTASNKPLSAKQGKVLSDLINSLESSLQTVGNGTITITQNGTAKGTFTTNQSGNTTIALTDNNTTYSNMTAATTSAAGKAGLVPAPAAGAQTKFLRGDGTWQVPTNTWRGIQDNLTSTSTTDSLSANQGRILKSLIPSSTYKLTYALQRTGTGGGNGITPITTYTPDYWYTTIGNIRILAMNIPIFSIPVNSTKSITVVLPIAFSNNSYYISISMNLGGNAAAFHEMNYAYCYYQTNSTFKIGVNSNDILNNGYGETGDFLSVLCIGIA